METIVFKEDEPIAADKLEKLYNSVGWSAYTDDMENLVNAVNHSLKVMTAWDGESLVGLIRVVGDGYSIIYIQDILVLKSYQKHGIGTKFMQMILEQYSQVRQKVLLTDNLSHTIEFYKSLGFMTAEDWECRAFVKFDYRP